MLALFEEHSRMDAEDRETIAWINAVLQRLAASRVACIEVEGELLKSKLAWKIASHRQSMLYRVVALASGSAASWNAFNPLCSILAARALIETIAALFSFSRSS